MMREKRGVVLRLTSNAPLINSPYTIKTKPTNKFNRYDVDLSFFDSATNKRGQRSKPLTAQTKDHASKDKKARVCERRGGVGRGVAHMRACLLSAILPNGTHQKAPDGPLTQSPPDRNPITNQQNCVYDPFELKMKKSSKPGMGDKFQLSIVGDYPTR